MKPLSSLLDEAIIRDLMAACAQDRFPQVDFKVAMQFLLTDGILPVSELPTRSFLQIEDWIRQKTRSSPMTYSATELKNKTGDILRAVSQGKEVVILRHGKPIAVIHPADTRR